MAKKAPIEFWFDFSSPYGYIASTQIDDLAEENGRKVVWRPFLLGPIFKASGNQPLIGQPLKGAYSKHDLERLARYFDIDFVLPDPFPIATLAAARAFYWLNDKDAGLAKRFAEAALHRYFGEGRDITHSDVVADIAADLGVNRQELLSAIKQPEVKDKVRAAVDEAMEKGICGSPFIIVDGEGFWGADRLWMVEEWLDTGGW